MLASAKDAVSPLAKRRRFGRRKQKIVLLACLEYAEYVDWLREQGAAAFAAKLKLALCLLATLVLKSKSAQRHAA